MFNLHHLRYFYACAQSGSITRAAKQLGISQPSLSMQLKQFEKQIGMQVLLRSGRAIALTPKGRELFAYSAKFFAVTGEIERYIKKNEPSLELDLRLGVSEDVERPFVADVLGKLVKMHKGKRLRSTILSKPHDELPVLLNDGEIDVIISTRKVRGAKLMSHVKIPVMLVLPGSLEWKGSLARTQVQSLLTSLGTPLILPLQSLALGAETSVYLERQQLKYSSTLQSNILACVVRAVEEGVGSAFLPLAYVKDQSQRGTLQYFGPREGFWQHSLYLHTGPSSQNPFLGDMVNIIRDMSVAV